MPSPSTTVHNEHEALRSELESVKTELAALTTSVQGLLDLWNQARGAVIFVKWASAIVGAVGASWLFFKGLLPK